MNEKGVRIKFFGPWQRAAGTVELFLPLEEPVTASSLVERLAGVYGERFPVREEGLPSTGARRYPRVPRSSSWGSSKVDKEWKDRYVSF